MLTFHRRPNWAIRASQGNRSRCTAGCRLPTKRMSISRFSSVVGRFAKPSNDLAARQQVAEAYLRLGRPTEAVYCFHGILEQDPGNQTALRALAEYYEQR